MSNIRSIGIVTVSLLVLALGVSQLTAEDRPTASQGKQVTLTGKLADMHCLMVGAPADKDPIKCARQCLRAGVPAVLETDSGIYLLGKGMEGLGREAVKHALNTVEVTGKLYEKHGMKYLDITSIAKVKNSDDTDDEDNELFEGSNESDVDNDGGVADEINRQDESEPGTE